MNDETEIGDTEARKSISPVSQLIYSIKTLAEAIREQKSWRKKAGPGSTLQRETVTAMVEPQSEP